MLGVYYKNLEELGMMTKKLEQQAAKVKAIDIQNYMAELCGEAFKAAWFIKATLSERGQEPVSGEYEPRAAHAIEFDHRLFRDPGHQARGSARAPLQQVPEEHPGQWPTPPEPDQRHSRSVEDRSRQVGD